MTTAPHDHCPRCKADISTYLAMKPDLGFCLYCQFPLQPIAGKYKLTAVLGEGGFGTVYRATHLAMVRDAERVIKIMKPEMMQAEGMKERFLREVQMTSALSQRNPHIVRVYDDFGEIPNIGHFYVMELLEGQTLASVLERELPPIGWCLDVFAQLCDAMQAAHDEQIVHRDLKPENIFLIHHRRRENFVKVLDFGIAKPLDRGTMGEGKEGRLTKGIIGTPFYISPEQVMNEGVDHRTDIYAMGVILHEMLTGQIPLVPPDQIGSISVLHLLSTRLMAEELPSLRALRPDREIPEGLDLTVRQALSRDPSKRFPSVEAFWIALQPFFQGSQHAPSVFESPISSPVAPYSPPPLTPSPSAASFSSTPHPSPASLEPSAQSASLSGVLPTPESNPTLDAASKPAASSTLSFSPAVEQDKKGASSDPSLAEPFAQTSQMPKAAPSSPHHQGGSAVPSNAPSEEMTVEGEEETSSPKRRWMPLFLTLGIVGLVVGGFAVRFFNQKTENDLQPLVESAKAKQAPLPEIKALPSSKREDPATKGQGDPTPKADDGSKATTGRQESQSDQKKEETSHIPPRETKEESVTEAPKPRKTRRGRRRNKVSVGSQRVETGTELAGLEPTNQRTSEPRAVPKAAEKPANGTGSPCRSDEIWLVGTPRLRLGDIHIAAKKNLRLVQRHLCLHQAEKDILISREGYVSCEFKMPKKKRKITIRLREDEGNQPASSYCLR
jgi:serine/threonine-protein kinase